MERRQTDGAECTLEQNVEMILGAGYDGISASFTDAGAARRIAALVKPHGKVLEGQCFPRTIDELEPALELLGDLSHFLVGREFATPISEENHAYMHRVIDNCWAFHGRVASREQVQIEISFPHHKMWLEIFLEWWEYGFKSWRRRAKADDTLSFVCELGPKPYAITGRDGNDTTDRWQEALLMRDLVRKLWNAL